MNILVYADTENTSLFIELARVVRSRAAFEQVEVIRSLDGLKERLRRLPRRIDVSVLVAATREQLDDIVAQKEFLEGTIVFLILPDQEKDTVARAAQLYPSFMGTVDSNLVIIGSVLEKMIDYSRIRSAGRPW